MLLGGLWHGANWTFVTWGAVHGLLLGLNHAWRAIPVSGSLAFKSRPAEAFAVLLTFTAVTFAWIPFRADSLADTAKMLSYIADPTILTSLWGSIESQFGGLKGLTSWFQPRELWPQVLPPTILRRRPGRWGYCCCASGLQHSRCPIRIRSSDASIRHWDSPTKMGGTVPWPDSTGGLHSWVAGMFLLSVLRLSHVSPFLYYQF
jgi:alginate O-acetyltransferase complex protein AlgI